MHLNGEALARLVDEAPNEDEKTHLAACDACCEALEAMKTNHRSLAALGDIDPPDDGWQRLEAGLAAEGLIGERETSRRQWAAPLRAAAAALIFIAGSVTGGTVVAMTGTAPTADPSADPPARLATTTSSEDIEAGLREAEENYLAAVGRYAEYSEPTGAIDPVNRLAALEGILLTTEAALRDAPADPIINNYHIATLGLREALMRQISENGEEEWF